MKITLLLLHYLITVIDDKNIKKRKKEHSNIMKLKEAFFVHGKIVLSCDSRYLLPPNGNNQ